MRIETILAEETIFDYTRWKGTDSDARSLQAWLDTLNFTAGRAPAGTKKLIGYLQFIQKHLDKLLKPPPKGYIADNWPAIRDYSRQQIKTTFGWWKPADIAAIETKLKKKTGEVNELRLKNAVYVNRSNFSFTRFKEAAQKVDAILSKLKGFHKKAVTAKPLIVALVKKSEIKAKAKYKGNDDLILIRPDTLASGDDYGSLPYVILHELGHRYEKFVRIGRAFTDSGWLTTPYSGRENMMGDEKFAELFALSNWPSKYPQYKIQVSRFLKVMDQ